MVRATLPLLGLLLAACVVTTDTSELPLPDAGPSSLDPCVDGSYCTDDASARVACVDGRPALTVCPHLCDAASGRCMDSCEVTNTIYCSEALDARAICDGAETVVETCGVDHRCVGGECLPVGYCAPGEGRCDEQGDLWVCDADGTSEVRVPCGDTPCAMVHSDGDGDLFGSVEAFAACPLVTDLADGGDCDDNNRLIHPDADEIWYDGVDQDCDGADDFDQDGDGHRAHRDVFEALCEAPCHGQCPDDRYCPVDCPLELPEGAPALSNDCDDTDPDVHPGATEVADAGRDVDCDGFVAFPSGSFDMGSPVAEEGHQDWETQHHVELTYTFEIQRTEVTHRDWLANTRNAYPMAHRGSVDLPIESVNLFEAMWYANLLSEAAGRVPCYVFDNTYEDDGETLELDPTLFGVGCPGDEELTCTNNVFRSQVRLQDAERQLIVNPIDCDGYRLPTSAEWEYAARSGEVGRWPDDEAGSTDELDLWAWYRETTEPWPESGGAGRRTECIAQLMATETELFDVLGNVGEWTTDPFGIGGIADDQVDPGPFGAVEAGVIGVDDYVVVRGGSAAQPTSGCRFATQRGVQARERSYSTGFRLARTLPEAE